MDIDREKLSKKFKEKDYNYFFEQAKIITNFLLIQNFKIYNKEIREDISQECLENLWKKVLKGKINPDQNLFAFIWKNSQFRTLEIFRKEKNRNRIAKFSNYDDLNDIKISDYIDYRKEIGYKYVDTNLKELWIA